MPGKLDQLIGMHVRDIMTVEVHTCTPDTTVAELMKMMTEHRIRHVPVVDGAAKRLVLQFSNLDKSFFQTLKYFLRAHF